MDGWLQVNDGRGNTGWFDKADAVLLEDAVGFFTERIWQNGTDVFAHNSRAMAWQLKGEFEIAIKDYNEVLRLDPSAFAYNNRGNVGSKKKDYDKAIADYNEAIRLNSKSSIYHRNRGSVWSKKKDYDKAIADFSEAIRLDPKYMDAFNERGLAFAGGKKDYDKSMADYNEAIRLDPKFAVGYYNKACVYALQRRTDPAIETLREALELGYRNFQHMEKDTDLDSIRNEARYKELLKKYMK